MAPGEIDSDPREVVEGSVQKALQQLMDDDAFLLANNASELSISHRFAMYLQQELPDWDVDAEYNRLGESVKKFSDDFLGLYRLVRPDIIVHSRNTSLNLLVVELKKDATDEERAYDIEKLHEFRTRKEYAYRYALFINFIARGKGYELEWV